MTGNASKTLSATQKYIDALEAIDSEVLLTGHLKELVDDALSSREPEAGERLYDASAPMADGETKMTAAEEVLSWLLIEKIGAPDDRSYSPNEAQSILEAHVLKAKQADDLEKFIAAHALEHKRRLAAVAALEEIRDMPVMSPVTVYEIARDAIAKASA